MEEATLGQTPTEDEIFFDIALPLLTHLQLLLMETVSVASLWRQLHKTIQLECVTDGQWHQMGNYVVLTVKFGIRDALVNGMLLAWLTRMAHWGPLHLCAMQLIPRVTLLSTGFFDETEMYTANLSRLWPAVNWALHMRATLTGLIASSPFKP